MYKGQSSLADTPLIDSRPHKGGYLDLATGRKKKIKSTGKRANKIVTPASKQSVIRQVGIVSEAASKLARKIAGGDVARELGAKRSVKPGDSSALARNASPNLDKADAARLIADWETLTDGVRNLLTNEYCGEHDPRRTWEQTARHALALLNSIVTTRNIDLHRTGIEQCRRDVEVLSGQREMYPPHRRVGSM